VIKVAVLSVLLSCFDIWSGNADVYCGRHADYMQYADEFPQNVKK
jgi:hypothetical protein